MSKEQESQNALEKQPCPICNKNSLTLSESLTEVPFFGKLYIFSMICSNCKYKKSDVEAEEQKAPCKFTFEVSSKEDLDVRIIKSSEASVKIPHIGSIEPGPASEGYITNIEGIIQRIKEQIEHLRDSEEDEDLKKKAKNLLKKIQKVLWGEEQIKIILEDPSGNSAIISDKALISK